MYYQSKLQVINNGEEDFVKVHHVPSEDRILQLVSVSDVVAHNIYGYTYHMLDKRKRSGEICFRDNRGNPVKRSKTSYVDLKELAGTEAPPEAVIVTKRRDYV